MGRVAAWVLMTALMLGAVAGGSAGSQTVAQAEASAAPVPETSVAAALRNLASRSGVVFVGQVVRIERKAGTVEIVFQVQQPVLGAVGATYTLREWSGLWTGGQQRYRLGQRAMMFLHAANGGGLSSPVDGMDGVVPVVVQGANTGALLDVRWLAARVLRAEGAPIADAENGAMSVADATAVVVGWKNNDVPEPVRRPLPTGVRPVQPLPAQPSMSTGAGGEAGPQPVTGTWPGLARPSAGALKIDGAHDTVQAAAPGGLDAIR